MRKELEYKARRNNRVLQDKGTHSIVRFMTWIIFRFVLLGPVTGSIVFSLLQTLGAPSVAPVGHTFSELDAAMALGEVLLAGAAGVVFTLPLSGSVAAFGGWIYSLALSRHVSGNFAPPLRALIGGAIGLAVTAVVGIVLFHSGDPVSSAPRYATFGFWCVSGLISGACCALSVGQSLYGLLSTRNAAGRV